MANGSLAILLAILNSALTVSALTAIGHMLISWGRVSEKIDGQANRIDNHEKRIMFLERKDRHAD